MKKLYADNKAQHSSDANRSKNETPSNSKQQHPTRKKENNRSEKHMPETPKKSSY